MNSPSSFSARNENCESYSPMFSSMIRPIFPVSFDSFSVFFSWYSRPTTLLRTHRRPTRVLKHNKRLSQITISSFIILFVKDRVTELRARHSPACIRLFGWHKRRERFAFYGSNFPRYHHRDNPLSRGIRETRKIQEKVIISKELLYENLTLVSLL